MSDVVNKGLSAAGDRARGLGSVFQGFKDFISRGNAIELAVGVVIGTAFGTVVSALQTGVIGPLIAALGGVSDISGLWTYTIGNDAKLSFGLVLNALLQFIITAAVVYFLIVLPLNKLAQRRKKGIEEEPASPSEDILLLQEIRDLLAAQGPAAQRSTGSGAHAAPGASPEA
ncbi:MAG TPA: large conductance mechanosensitive channel protein MscL [Cellulomonas sp.]